MIVALSILIAIIIAGMASFSLDQIPMTEGYRRWAKIVLVIVLLFMFVQIFTGKVDLSVFLRSGAW